jgi:hypothetical protein
LTSPNQLKDLIIEKFKEKEEIPGSVIGLQIRRAFPDTDMKRLYGGLKRFIQEYCGDEIVWLRKNGGDDVYGHVATEGKEARTSKSSAPQKSEFQDSVWTVFSNPNLERQILLNKETGELIVREPGDSLSEPFVVIEKITREEYREMAWQFLPKLTEPQKNDFRQALSLDNFWPHWSAVLWRHKTDGIFDQWLKWRADQIVNLFEARLARAQIPDNLSSVAVRELKRKPPKPSSLREPRHIGVKNTRDSEGRLRLLVHNAIDRMGEEELRRIWLPLGTLADLLK